MVLLLPLVSHMKLGPVGQMMKEYIIKGIQERDEKETQEAASLYPHGHWIQKLLLKPVQENTKNKKKTKKKERTKKKKKAQRMQFLENSGKNRMMQHCNDL